MEFRTAESTPAPAGPRPGPLGHLRVLDLSRVLAGPWASQLLADLGADVIKVERPGLGDDTRRWGPPWLRDQAGAETGESSYYLSANRGKRSVTIDLAHPDGQALVRRLAARADVLLENFRVGGLEAYGLDYASLSALNPRLVYCSITGFGQTGPSRHRAGYDFLLQGMGGLMSITGAPDGHAGGGPMKVGVAVTDLMTGMYAATAVLAALAHRERSGVGQQVDLSLLDVQVAMLANQAQAFLATGEPPGRLGNAHPSIVPYQSFAAADRHFVIAVGNDGQFTKLSEVIGLAALSSDPRFATNAARVANRAALLARLEPALAARPAGEWVAALEAVGVPCGPINDLRQVFDDPQVRHRGLRQEVDHPVAGRVELVASPIRLSGTPLPPPTAPPTLGQQTDEVLAELGLGAAEVAALRASGAV
jgi:crotonobetainyl-CoA:carnitine CoA-transferase CaiB-like acyl-CoA transferase